MFNNTTNSVWTNDWNATSRDRSVYLKTQSLVESDSLYKYFSLTCTIKVVNADVYYAMTAGNRDIYFGLEKKDEARNFEKYLKTGYLRFYMNVPKDMRVRIGITDSDYSRSYVVVDLKKTTENSGWQEVQIPFKDFYDNNPSRSVDFKNIIRVYVESIDTAENATFSEENFLKENDESLQVSRFEFWTKTPDDPDKDEYWESLPSLGDEDESSMFNNTATSFWTNDWNATSRDRSISISLKSLDASDPLCKYFPLSCTVKVVDADVYYAMTAGNRDINFGLEKKDEARNFEKYLKTGYLRFYMNVPKDMRIRIGITDDGFRRTYVVVDLKKTTENSGWQEVQIPFKDFYDNNPSHTVDFKNIVRVYVESVDTAENATFSEESFLKENDEILQFSRFECWTKTPDDPSKDKYWESLPSLGEDDESYMFNNTTNSLWTNDWNATSRDRSISISTQSLNKKDPLFKYFPLSCLRIVYLWKLNGLAK